MSQVVCIGYDRNSYNNYRMCRTLKKNNIEYVYYNINEVLESKKELNLKGKKILFMDDNLAASKEDFDIALSAISRRSKSTTGQLFDLLRTSNASFYNNIDSHFKTFNKWCLYNLLSSHSIHTPSTKLLGQNINIEEIKKEFKPLFIKSTSSQDRNNYIKYNFICDNVEYLTSFYNEYVLTGSDNLYIAQEYIQHDFFITASVAYNTVKFLISDREKTISLPLYTIKPSYSELLTRVRDKLKLNCFSVNFVESRGRNTVLRVKVPGELCLVDTVFNEDMVGNIVLGFIRNG